MKAKLVESHLISPTVKHFTFEAPDVSDLPYQTGQFVSFTHEHGGRKITRAYSTCSRPQGNRFELCLNIVEEGKFSPYLFTLEPGAELEFRGPLGNFVWREPVRDSILVGTGTGVAPYRGMLQERLAFDHEHQFTLVFGARHEENLLYRAEFEQMEREHANFSFRPTLSRPPEHWTGLTGYVQDHVLAAVGDRRDLDVYVCGQKAMVDDLRNRLKEIGFDRKQIVFEKYD